MGVWILNSKRPFLLRKYAYSCYNSERGESAENFILGGTKMLKKLKRHRFLFCFIGTLCVFGMRAVHYYVNGQSIASAHLDGHVFAPLSNVFIAVILAIILIVIFIIKKQNEIQKWFLIPVIIIAFALLHIYIGSLFECCPGG